MSIFGKSKRYEARISKLERMLFGLRDPNEHVPFDPYSVGPKPTMWDITEDFWQRKKFHKGTPNHWEDKSKL